MPMMHNDSERERRRCERDEGALMHRLGHISPHRIYAYTPDPEALDTSCCAQRFQEKASSCRYVAPIRIEKDRTIIAALTTVFVSYNSILHLPPSPSKFENLASFGFDEADLDFMSSYILESIYSNTM